MHKVPVNSGLHTQENWLIKLRQVEFESFDEQGLEEHSSISVSHLAPV